MNAGGGLDEARAASVGRRWKEAFAGFAAVDRAGALEPDDLVAMSEAAFWSSDLPGAIAARSRAHAGFERAGRLVETADTALALCRLYAVRGELAIAAGWLEGARRILDDLPESYAHAHLAYLDAYVQLLMKDYAGTAAHACEAEAIATRVGDRDLQMLARALRGFTAVHAGDVANGMRLLDEAAASATSGRLSPFASAEIVCEIVVSSLDVADDERAIQWLDLAERSDHIVSFPGCCRVHRTTVLRHRGDWEAARASALRARAEVAGVEIVHEGMALTEIGELARGRGDLALAEDAFVQAHEKGWAPQPGLALVRLEQQDGPGAAQMLSRSVEHADQELASLVALLPAQVEIALAGGDAATATAAARRLDEVATTLGTSTARAASELVAGRLRLADADAAGAVRAFERAVAAWQRARRPYEVARARVELADALEAQGDPTSGRLELEAARATFERLGARPAALALARRLGDETPRFANRTFMFTDIVNSTELLTTIGDEAWNAMRLRHHRAATTTFAEHGGSTVKDTGDGFFVAFDDVPSAVASAIALQCRLDEQRRTDGFAPRVRIGVHVGSAIVDDRDYRGRDVVVAARIGALAGADEILVSGAVAAALGDGAASTPIGSRVLKGIPAPVEIARVDWRSARAVRRATVRPMNDRVEGSW